MTLKAGDTLWYVEVGYRITPEKERGKLVEVIAVGRKWATLAHGYPRIDLETLWADGGRYSPPGRCYSSQDAYLAELRLNSLWHRFNNRFHNRHSAPDGITESRIREAAAALNISLED